LNPRRKPKKAREIGGLMLRRVAFHGRLWPPGAIQHVWRVHVERAGGGRLYLSSSVAAPTVEFRDWAAV
jgi:hypothetical protein